MKVCPAAMGPVLTETPGIAMVRQLHAKLSRKLKQASALANVLQEFAMTGGVSESRDRTAKRRNSQ